MRTYAILSPLSLLQEYMQFVTAMDGPLVGRAGSNVFHRQRINFKNNKISESIKHQLVTVVSVSVHLSLSLSLTPSFVFVCVYAHA